MSTDVISLGISRQRTLKDQLSPYKIAVLILIEDYCRAGPHDNMADDHSYSDVEELTFLTTLLQLIQVLVIRDTESALFDILQFLHFVESLLSYLELCVTV